MHLNRNRNWIRNEWEADKRAWCNVCGTSSANRNTLDLKAFVALFVEVIDETMASFHSGSQICTFYLPSDKQIFYFTISLPSTVTTHNNINLLLQHSKSNNSIYPWLFLPDTHGTCNDNSNSTEIDRIQFISKQIKK